MNALLFDGYEVSPARVLPRAFRREACLGLLLSIVVGCAPCLAQSTTLASLKVRGRNLFAARKFEESRNVWRQVAALAGSDVEALQNLGVIEGLLGNHAGANGYLERVVRLRPNSAQDLNNLAVNYLALEQAAAALRLFERAVRIAPRNANLWFNVGGLYFDQKKYKEAAPAFERAATLAPTDAALEYKLLVCYLQIRDLTRAAALWQRALHLKSLRDSAAHTTIAELFLHNDEYLSASEFYGLAVKADQHNPLLIYNQGRALFLAKKPAQAWEVLASLGPDKLHTAELHQLKADVLVQLGRLDEALPEYHEAIQLKPQEQDLYLRLALVLLQGQAFDDAIAFLSESKKNFPTSPRMHTALGYAHQAEGETSQAVRHYREAINMSPDFPLSYILLGNALIEAGDYAEGLEVLKQAVKIAPASPETNYALARGLLRVTPENRTEIKHYLNQSVRSGASFADGYFALGKLELQSGNLREAKALLEKSQAIDPSLPGTHYSLGQVYRRLGEIQKAEEHFRLHQSLERQGQESGAFEKRLVYSPGVVK